MYAFLKSLLTSMFHYKIAVLHAKSFVLLSPVAPSNTENIQSESILSLNLIL
jgi:hypothetical protein